MKRSFSCLIHKPSHAVFLDALNRPRLFRFSSTTAKHIGVRYLPPDELLISLQIGTPSQLFSVFLDTGSTDLWLLQPSHRRAKFIPSKSSTWQQSRSHWAVKYADAMTAEGVEGIETIRIGEWECDARLGVANNVYVQRNGKRVRTETIPTLAGRIDGVFGAGLDSSLIIGLRERGARAIKLSFRRDGEGKDGLEILKDTDAEKDVVWCDVITTPGQRAWEIVLSGVSYGVHKSLVPPLQKILLDTGCVHHYLPRRTAEILFSEPTLYGKYERFHIAKDHDTPVSGMEAFWELKSGPHPNEPVHVTFAGSRVKWPVPLESLLDKKQASIRMAGHGGRAILGLRFLSQFKSVIFDFTEGHERIGFIPWDGLPVEHGFADRPRERAIQFLVGSFIALALVFGFKWSEGSNPTPLSKDPKN